jgi:hypothetical protein
VATPPEVSPYLERLIGELWLVLGDRLSGVYGLGGLALGDFRPPRAQARDGARLSGGDAPRAMRGARRGGLAAGAGAGLQLGPDRLRKSGEQADLALADARP